MKLFDGQNFIPLDEDSSGQPHINPRTAQLLESSQAARRDAQAYLAQLATQDNEDITTIETRRIPLEDVQEALQHPESHEATAPLPYAIADRMVTRFDATIQSTPRVLSPKLPLRAMRISPAFYRIENDTTGEIIGNVDYTLDQQGKRVLTVSTTFHHATRGDLAIRATLTESQRVQVLQTPMGIQRRDNTQEIQPPDEAARQELGEHLQNLQATIVAHERNK